MKKLIALVTILFAATANAQSDYVQKQNEIEFKRLYQEIEKLNSQNEQYSVYIRKLEKDNDDLTKKITALDSKIESLLDLWVNFENVSLPNLVSADKALANRINESNNHIKEQTQIWNWGEESRDCKGIGSHQQVKAVLAKDGSSVTQYLCFDGKVLHLNTVSNIPPVE